MCKFLSAIVTRQGDVFCNPLTDSHEDLIDLYGLKDNSNIEKFVRVEFCPHAQKDYTNPDKYVLRVDESAEPAWFAEFRDKTISKLLDIIKRMVITDKRKILIGGVYILAGGAKIEACKHVRIVQMWGNSQVNEMRENSQVNEMRENSRVDEMWENSQVNTMRGNSRVDEMWGNSQVNEMRENSQVNEMWGNSQVNEMWENSQVNEMWGNSQVNEMWGNSQVNKNNTQNKEGGQK